MNQREGIKYTLSHTDKRKGGGGGAKHFTAQTHMHAIRKKERERKKERKKERKEKKRKTSKQKQ